MHIEVPGDGPVDAPITFIGEAPGESERMLRRPFVGPSGRLLDGLLKQAGLVRVKCRLTNVIKEKPHLNDISLFINLDRKDVWMSDEYKLYEQYLYEELSKIPSNVLVPVGRVSLWAITRLKGIMKWRGSVITAVPELNHRKVIPIIHPASILRGNYQHTYTTVHDLRKIAEESKDTVIHRSDRTLRTAPSFLEAMAYLDDCFREPIISFDIEVSRQTHELTCIAFAKTPYDVMSIPFVRWDGFYYTEDHEAELMLKIARLLEDTKIVKVGQNTKFDAYFLYHKYGIRTRPIECTMIAHGILYPELPKGLDYMTSTLTDVPYYKDEGKFTAVIGTGKDAWKRYWEYNCKDAAVTLEIWEKLERMLEKQENTDTYRRQSATIEPILFIQERGIKADKSGLDAARVESETTVATLTAELEGVMGKPLPPKFLGSPKQIMAYLYDEQGWTPVIDRKTHKRTSGDDALKRLSRKGCKEASILRKIRKEQKLISSYFKMDLDKDDRFRSDVNPVGTPTGRWSSSKTIFGTGGNFQNTAKPFRKMLRADDGYMLIEVDLSRAESVCVAYMGPVPQLREAIENGTDVHRQTYGLMFGIPFDEVSNVPGSSPLGTGAKSQRDWGKTFNHALAYDLGYRTFGFRYEIREPEARDLVERFHQIYPGIRQNYHTMVRRQLEENRTVVNGYGRKRFFMERWGDELFKAAYSHVAQSTVADKINVDGVIPLYYSRGTSRRSELLAQVHDSILFQHPTEGDEGWTQVARSIKDVVVRLETTVPWKDPFVIKAEAKVGVVWGDLVTIEEDVAAMSINDLSQKLEEVYREASDV